MYEVNGRVYAPDDPVLQELLSTAHVQGTRPRCVCTGAAVPVYIARSADRFVLKRMPFTGHLHQPGCRHRDPSAESSATDITHPSFRADPVTGLIRITAGFAMSDRHARTGAAKDRPDRLHVRHHDERISLHDLLLYLWHKAELTFWRPAFAGKRSWAVVRHHLLQAAGNLVVNGVPMADALFVPEPFSVPQADAIRARRLERFGNGFREQPPSRQRMLLIGEVKAIRSATLQPHVLVRHLPDVPLRLADAATRRLVAQRPLQSGALSPHLVIAATFSLPDLVTPQIEEFCLLPMSAEWLPVVAEPDTRSHLESSRRVRRPMSRPAASVS